MGYTKKKNDMETDTTAGIKDSALTPLVDKIVRYLMEDTLKILAERIDKLEDQKSEYAKGKFYLKVKKYICRALHSQRKLSCRRKRRSSYTCQVFFSKMCIIFSAIRQCANVLI